MRTLLVLATAVAVLGLVAAPTVAADPTPSPPPGFGHCELVEGPSVATTEPTGDVHTVELQCYW